MKILNLGEFGLINRIKQLVPQGRDVVMGIGDDTAVLPLSSSKYLLFKTDMLIEGRHFTRRIKPELIGRKALACNISDVAAMGGTPTSAVVALGLPKNLPVKFVNDLYKGMSALAREFNVSIVGGDTNASDKIIISVALLGEVPRKHLTTRAGAKAGDWIFVSGVLGGSLKSGRHLSFTPRVGEAQFLVNKFKPTAMMDISDGLGGDLNHILNASKVGAKLWEDAIPRHKGVSLKQALSDGEDFELLFTLPAAKAQKLMHWQFQRKQLHFYPIGEIIANKNKKVYAQGYTHF